MSTLNPIAAIGFGRGADHYAASRPGYPVALGGWLYDDLAVDPVTFPYLTKAYDCRRIA